MKTPEELAEEYTKDWWGNLPEAEGMRKSARENFLAGYQAAKDQLADVDKVIIPKENCEAAMKAMQSAQKLSEQAITWMKTLPPASERCNQCACEGYRAGYQAAAPQWISVKERMPEKNSELLLLMCVDGYEIGYYERYKGYGWTNVLGTDCLNVTHWQELPEPPKEEG